MTSIYEVRERLERELSHDFGPAIAVADDLRALLADHARLQADSDRLDWMDSNHFTAYRQCDPIDGLSGHCVVVPEAVTQRRGCVNDGIREAIDAAKAVQP